ncbi:hypothetical protein [Bradyrhizobium sp. LTSP885]|uniref:hypothetical protein n=1 Tax=Bradyrhizobium sp. LTSP885 TaxID=1619232 RepID=UPI0005CB4125|nr:hypothetical protein [Bradyrhizobium sp. LTSP885]
MFDADCTTSEASMWARMWWDEGPLKMWFSTPIAPRSIEAPERVLYESWPPGAFVPVYLIAMALGREPSVPIVNWINTGEHGLIALAAALIAFNIASMNRIGKVSSGLIAVGVSFPILLSRGPLYVFSQVYDVTNAVLIYTTLFLLLETLFYSAQREREKRIITAFELVIIFTAFFVDWLSYTLFAFWIFSRLAASYFGVETRMRMRGVIALCLLPMSAFGLYLVWRFFAPDSMARQLGVATSVHQLFLKIQQRMNLSSDSPISGFMDAFVGQIHTDFYTPIAFALIAGSTLATLVLVMIAFRRACDPAERKAVFATGSILFLVTVPFYVHMLILYEHTFIHRWAIMKAMLAYGLVPFALLPIAALATVRPFMSGKALPRFGFAVLSLAVALCAIVCAETITEEPWYLLGRVNRTAYLMWDDIGRNTRYEDVVVSPVLEAAPISAQIGASYKLVHLAKDFAEADKVVERLCGDYNLVVALPEGTYAGDFASRQPAEAIDTGRIRLLRFQLYRGKALGCP